MSQLSNEEIERIARKRAGAKLGWYIHATVYVVVNVFLYLMSNQVWGTRNWSVAPVLGWGLGVVLHGVSVFIMGSSSSFREHLVRKEREKLQREQGGQ